MVRFFGRLFGWHRVETVERAVESEPVRRAPLPPVPLRSVSEILGRMRDVGIVRDEDLKGCSPDEILALEEKYGLALPASYREYLACMGKCSGLLFRSDHLAASYEHVLNLTQEVRDAEFAEHAIGPLLPDDSLVICGRLFEQFEYIRCNDPRDSAVWYFNEAELDSRYEYDSVIEWLAEICREAESAVYSGYFQKHPGGTSP